MERQANVNPNYIGPGYWTSWHRRTIHANNLEAKIEAGRAIAYDIKFFPCLECRDHARKYVKLHSIQTAVDDSHPYSLFYWVVDFHNTVNRRQGKNEVTREEALNMWSDAAVCKEKDCGK